MKIQSFPGWKVTREWRHRADYPSRKRWTIAVMRFVNTLSRRETFNFGPEIPHGWFWPYSKGPTAWAADGSRYENRRTIVISGPFIPPWRSRGEDRYRASVRRRFVVSRLRAKFSRNAALKGFDRLCKTRCAGSRPLLQSTTHFPWNGKPFRGQET